MAKPDPRLEKAHLAGKSEVLEQLLQALDAQIEELGVDIGAVAEESDRIGAQLDALTKHASAAEGDLRKAEEQRAKGWSLLRAQQSRRVAIRGLLSRFKLLDEQYESDLKRLGAAVESDYVFSQLPLERCPLCGGPLPSASHGHEHSEEAVPFAEACKSEIRKVQTLRAELKRTSDALAEEDVQLTAAVGQTEERLAALNLAIAQQLQPIRAGTAKKLRELAERRGVIERATALVAQRASLQERLAPAKARPSRADGREAKTLTRATTSDTDAFCHTVEGLLREWRYPGLQRVTFSEQHQDLVISGKDRESQGKGLRAVAYAAFAIGLLRYCRERGLPHPGLVVLDSPLVTYRRPDITEEERLPQEVKEAFFDFLTRLRRDEQVIVFENDDPPLQVRQGLTWTHFSGAPGIGRRGFYPT